MYLATFAYYYALIDYYFKTANKLKFAILKRQSIKAGKTVKENQSIVLQLATY